MWVSWFAGTPEGMFLTVVLSFRISIKTGLYFLLWKTKMCAKRTEKHQNSEYIFLCFCLAPACDILYIIKYYIFLRKLLTNLTAVVYYYYDHKVGVVGVLCPHVKNEISLFFDTEAQPGQTKQMFGWNFRRRSVAPFVATDKANRLAKGKLRLKNFWCFFEAFPNLCFVWLGRSVPLFPYKVCGR